MPTGGAALGRADEDRSQNRWESTQRSVDVQKACSASLSGQNDLLTIVDLQGVFKGRDMALAL